MRRRRTLDRASASGSPDLTLSEKDWAAIESGYRVRGLLGHGDGKLPLRAREQIVEATRNFLYWATFELTAAPAADAEKLATMARKSAQDHVEHLSKLLISSDAASRVRQLIEEKQPPSSAGHCESVRALLNRNTAFIVACRRAERELSECDGFQEGSSWRQWVRALAKVLREHSLKVTVRKDASGDAASPVVILVCELQHRIPKEYRRYTWSDGALAQQISASLRKPKGEEAAPTEPVRREL